MNSVSLSAQDFLAISPLLVLVGAALLLLLFESLFADTKKMSGVFALFSLVLALLFALRASVTQNELLTQWIRFDAVAQFFTVFFLLVGLSVVVMSSSFFKNFQAKQGEFYFLLLSAIFGLVLIGQSADFLILFIGIETLSISLYVLCAYMKRWAFSQEAAIKYFLLGALSSALLLFGIALIYGALGTTQFDALLSGYQLLTQPQEQLLFLSGIAFVTLGLFFKAAIVPFHTWAPDVYDGAPTPVTAFMAVGTKAGAFAALIILFIKALPFFNVWWSQAAVWLAMPTLIYANWVALRQTQLRRFFAYSGISHAGFLLVGIASGSLPAVSFYLMVYALATLGIFASLTILENKKEGLQLNDLKGLFFRSPLLAAAMGFALLTLAGLPPTAGFLAKFYIFKEAFSQGYYAVVVVGLITAVLALFYYIRIVALMFMEEAALPKVSFCFTTALALVCFLSIVFLSFWPKAALSFL